MENRQTAKKADLSSPAPPCPPLEVRIIGIKWGLLTCQARPCKGWNKQHISLQLFGEFKKKKTKQVGSLLVSKSEVGIEESIVWAKTKEDSVAKVLIKTEISLGKETSWVLWMSSSSCLVHSQCWAWMLSGPWRAGLWKTHTYSKGLFSALHTVVTPCSLQKWNFNN